MVTECYESLIPQGVSVIGRDLFYGISEICLTLSGLRVGTKMGTNFAGGFFAIYFFPALIFFHPHLARCAMPVSLELMTERPSLH